MLRLSTREINAELRRIDEEIDDLQERKDVLGRLLVLSQRSGRSGTRRNGAAVKKHVKAIAKYLHDNGEARQADITKDLGLNSGVVSVTLGVMEDDQVASRAEQKQDRSAVWGLSEGVDVKSILSAPEEPSQDGQSSDGDRETVVHAGDQVRGGRRRGSKNGRSGRRPAQRAAA